MRFYLVKIPRIITRLFSNYTWYFSSSKKEIYITFDDGPTPKVTDFVLNQLKKHNAKATFFCIGKNIKNHPQIFKRIVSEGHSVGNHTQNHCNGWKYLTKKYIENVLECEKKICSHTKKSNIFRPPYGKIKNSQAKKLIKKNYRIIMWSVLSGDFDTSISKEKCLQNVLKNTKNGSIIVFHDSIKASEKLYYTLPKALEEFSKKGYVLKAIK